MEIASPMHGIKRNCICALQCLSQTSMDFNVDFLIYNNLPYHNSHDSKKEDPSLQPNGFIWFANSFSMHFLRHKFWHHHCAKL